MFTPEEVRAYKEIMAEYVASIVLPSPSICSDSRRNAGPLKIAKNSK